MTKEIELSSLDLRYEGHRMKNPGLEERLLVLIAQRPGAGGLHRRTLRQRLPERSRNGKRAFAQQILGSMRLGLISEMSAAIRAKLFSGAFPVYSYMYTLRQFMRMNGVRARMLSSSWQLSATKA
jgi:hypothetical protein